MATKKWRLSPSGGDWWYIPQEVPTPTNSARVTLNIVRKNGFKIYLHNKSVGGTAILLKKTNKLSSARSFAKSWMKKNPRG